MNRHITGLFGPTIAIHTIATLIGVCGHTCLTPAMGGEPFVVVPAHANVTHPGKVLGQLKQGQLVEVLQEQDGWRLVEVRHEGKWVKGWVEPRHLTPYQYKVNDQVVSVRLVMVKQLNWYDAELWPGGWYNVQRVGRNQLFLSDQGPLNWVDQTAVLPMELAEAHFDRLVREAIAKKPEDRDLAATAYAGRATFRMEVLARQTKSKEQREAVLQKALNDYITSRDFDPNESMTHNSIGMILRRQGKLDDAVQSYTKAIEINPKDSRAFNNRANIMQDQGEYSKAIDDYVNAVRAYPRNVSAYNSLRMMERTFAIVSVNKKNTLDRDMMEKYYTAVSELAPVFENDPSMRGLRAIIGP